MMSMQVEFKRFHLSIKANIDEPGIECFNCIYMADRVELPPTALAIIKAELHDRLHCHQQACLIMCRQLNFTCWYASLLTLCESCLV